MTNQQTNENTDKIEGINIFCDYLLTKKRCTYIISVDLVICFTTYEQIAIIRAAA